MPIIYGSGFKPIIYQGKKQQRDTGKASLFIFLRVFTAITFIALSFIPIVGEAADAGLIAAESIGEAAISQTAAALENDLLTTVASVSLDEAIATGDTTLLEASSTVSNTMRNLRLGETLKGSLGLGIAEATINEIVDRMEGTDSLANSLINFGLSSIPFFGVLKGQRAAGLRLKKTINQQLNQYQELLSETTDAETITQIELKIRQLKNAKLIKTSRLYASPINSREYGASKIFINEIVDEAVPGTKLTKRYVGKELKNKLSSIDIKLSKNETKNIVNSIAKKIPSIHEGLTLKGFVESRAYNNFVNLLRLADPNMLARKFWTAAARKLTSDEALLVYHTKSGTKEFGKWFKNVNVGYYKKFGRKISNFWRKFGLKFYKASMAKMIPVSSSWIQGYRIIETPIPGEYIMIIIFQRSPGGRIPSPVVVNPVTLDYVYRFSNGIGYDNSVGSFYINEIAFARNGVSNTFVSSLSSILGVIPLGVLRQALSGPAALERLIRRFASGNYFSSFGDNIIETSNRLWPHKIGKVLAGRWGIATARGFQKIQNHRTVFTSHFDIRYLIDEIGVVTLDKARAIQRKANILGRTSIIGARRQAQQYRRIPKLGTLGIIKFDGKKGFKKAKTFFN